MAALQYVCLLLLAPVILAMVPDDGICVAKVVCDKTPKSCKDVKDDDAHTVYKTAMMDDGMDMLCDTQLDNGGWTVIQRRTKGDLDFNRNWDEYKYGFGSYDGDFWYGLERIHKLTTKSHHELYVSFDHEGKSYYARYSHFQVMSEVEQYKLKISGYKGNAGDAMKYHANAKFTTKDRDNDVRSGNNCAVLYHGAWWHVSCHQANLNGLWGSTDFGKGLNWKPTTTHNKSATKVVMRIRRLY